jgi:hypothetical protein
MQVFESTICKEMNMTYQLAKALFLSALTIERGQVMTHCLNCSTVSFFLFIYLFYLFCPGTEAQFESNKRRL